MVNQLLTMSSWDLPDDVFTEGEVRPKKKTGKPKANGAASAAAAEDTKKRAAAEVSSDPLHSTARRLSDLVFLTAWPLSPTAGNGTPRKATTAGLSSSCWLNDSSERIRFVLLRFLRQGATLF